MSTAIATTTQGNGVPSQLPSGIPAIHAALDELKALRTFVAAELKEGTDYGVIPGTGTKPTLLKPGAQKVTMYFNCYPRFRIQRQELGNGHLEVLVNAKLVSRTSRNVVGEGNGSCTSMESRYRFRKAARKCPRCNAEAIIQGKAEYGGGWLCFAKKGGCGAKYRQDDADITSQATGQAENENIHDVRNTVLKIGEKRAHVDAALGLGCMSELFTQDLDDVYDLSALATEPEPMPTAAPTRPQNESGHKTGQYASPEQVRDYLEALDGFLLRKNQAWLDHWTDDGGDLPSSVKREPLNRWQADNHLLKWCVETGRLDPATPEQGKARQVGAYTAIVYHRTKADHRALALEMDRYADEQIARADEAIRAKHPELFAGEAVEDDDEPREAGSDDE